MYVLKHIAFLITFVGQIQRNCVSDSTPGRPVLNIASLLSKDSQQLQSQGYKKNIKGGKNVKYKDTKIPNQYRDSKYSILQACYPKIANSCSHKDKTIKQNTSGREM